MALTLRDGGSYNYQQGDAVLCAAKKASDELPAYANALATFSKQLSSCYTELANDHPEFKALRKDVLQHALLYRDLHLQAAKVFIKELADWVGNYVECKFHEFLQDLDLIVEDAAQYLQHADLVSGMHRELYMDAQQLAARAQTTARTIKLEQRSLDAAHQRLTDKAARHAQKCENADALGGLIWTASLVAAPLTGGASLVVAAPVAMAVGAYEDHHRQKESASAARALAASQNARNAATAAEIISGPMTESVNQFIRAMAAAATFFQAVTDEVGVYQEKAEQAQRLRNAHMEQENMRRIERHYRRMTAPAKNLLALCKLFNASVPQFEAQLELLALKEATDGASYIQVWLESKEKQLKLEHGPRRNYLRNCLSGMTANIKALALPQQQYQ